MNPITELAEIDFIAFLLTAFIIISAVVAITTMIGKFFKIIGKTLKWFNKQNQDHELLITTTNTLNELQKRHEEDVKQSIRHDDMIRNDLSKLTETVNTMIDKLDVMEEKRNASEKAKLKDRIAQAYRKYHEDGKWTKMDKEAYLGLIKDYENHGGTNSFVHEICEPESYTWEIID